MANCKSCGRFIKWVKTVKGKSMPVDPDRIKYSEAEIGDILIDDSGNTIKKTAFPQPSVRGYISHFSTCPQADEWRKR